MFPVKLYGTLWLLLIPYLTVFLPLGVRTIAGVMTQIDPNLEECAEVCGASILYRLRTITLPLARPGLIAAAIQACGIKNLKRGHAPGWKIHLAAGDSLLFADPEGLEHELVVAKHQGTRVTQVAAALRTAR